MKIALTILASLAIAASAFAQGKTLTVNTNTYEIRWENPLRIKATNALLMGGVGGEFEVLSKSNLHGIVSKVTNSAGGAAFYGWSESGAPAMKLVQTNNYTSPTATFWRAGTGDYSSPQVLIAGNATNGTNIALQITNFYGVNTGFSVNYNGVAFAPPTVLANTVIDWAACSTFVSVLVANKTFSFTNSTSGQTIIVRVVNEGAWTVAWPTSGTNNVMWSGGTEPTQTANATDIYTFVNIAGTIYGAQNPNLR